MKKNFLKSLLYANELVGNINRRNKIWRNLLKLNRQSLTNIVESRLIRF